MTAAIVTFTNGLAFAGNALIVCGSGDVHDAFEQFTRVFQFVNQTPEKWWSHDVGWRAVKCAYFGPTQENLDDFVVLSDEGNIHYVGPNHEKAINEKIPGAGVFSEDAKGWGYMSSLKQIGDHLYACGGAGQVYKRLGPNQWRHMDDGLLQKPDTDARLLPDVIDGPHEKAIYLAGAVSVEGLPPFVYYWNGQAWHSIQLPAVAERITAMHVESEHCIWLCGANGTLLMGNAREGFRSLSTVDDNQLFTSITQFQGQMYLASNYGLFVYDPQKPSRGIQRVKTTLKPDLQDANIVDAVDGVLWSIGPKDIARFDGQQWERIHHPDNPRIEEPKANGWEG